MGDELGQAQLEATRQRLFDAAARQAEKREELKRKVQFTEPEVVNEMDTDMNTDDQAKEVDPQPTIKKSRIENPEMQVEVSDT